MYVHTEYLYTNVYSNFTHNSQKLEITQMFFSGGMIYKTVVHPYHEIVFNNKRNQLLVHTAT